MQVHPDGCTQDTSLENILSSSSVAFMVAETQKLTKAEEANRGDDKENVVGVILDAGRAINDEYVSVHNNASLEGTDGKVQSGVNAGNKERNSKGPIDNGPREEQAQEDSEIRDALKAKDVCEIAGLSFKCDDQRKLLEKIEGRQSATKTKKVVRKLPTNRVSLKQKEDSKTSSDGNVVLSSLIGRKNLKNNPDKTDVRKQRPAKQTPNLGGRNLSSKIMSFPVSPWEFRLHLDSFANLSRWQFHPAPGYGSFILHSVLAVPSALRFDSSDRSVR
ncbi:hypothetical protein PIB30_018195 [Stylosanthes scabra]|uniref:Uncharacterized protein n=1 Tax=Stylosanthes scabra TaxID=79078 RepID=A0ABU6T7N7_9FABA|nr:hypothetical protein [Stylosanthes scabra]